MANEQIVFVVAGIVGFGPAIAVLYHALRTYDYPFTEKSYFDTRRVFFALAVGMVIGTVSGFVNYTSGKGIDLVGLAALLVIVAVFEEAFKLIYLNRKGYRGRFDTTFVGVGLGTGITGIYAAAIAYVNGPNLFSASVALPLLALSVSLAFLQPATAAIIGLGCYRGEILVPFGQALVARVLHAAILVPFYVWFAVPQEGALAVASLAAAIAFTAVLYVYVYRTVLPATLPPELRRERRRTVRKRGRE